MKTRVLLAVLALAMAGPAPSISRAGGATDVAGVPAATVGEHGPILDYATGDVELVGHSDITPPGKTKALGNNGAVALIDHCAYVGRWHDYGTRNLVNIIDVADPANPVVLPPPDGSSSSTTGAVPGTAIASAVARELRAIDIAPSARFPNGVKMLSILTFSNSLTGGLRTEQNSMLFYTFPSGDCTKPVQAGAYIMNSFRGHEFFQWIDPNPDHDVNGLPRVLEYVTTPLSGTDMIVLDATNPAAVALIGLYNAGIPAASATEANLVGGVPVGAGKYTHSISLSPDGRTAYVSHWDGGYFTADTSDFADAAPAPLVKPRGAMTLPLATNALGNTHSAVVIPGSDTVVAGDEIYVTTDGCPFGWMHLIDAGDEQAPPSQIGEFKLAENDSANCDGLFAKDRNASGLELDGTFSMHNQTVTPHFVLTSWYGGGMRVIDISDPAHPTEAGFFVPKPVEEISSNPDTPAPIYGRTPGAADDWWVSTWSYPVIRDGLIYVTDIRNGLYVLRPTAGSSLEAELSGIGFLEGNSNLNLFR